jgi:hypothetical protein
MTETDNYHDGIFTRWIAALSAAPCNLKVYFVDFFSLGSILQVFPKVVCRASSLAS